jgi:hypothetical protein
MIDARAAVYPISYQRRREYRHDAGPIEFGWRCLLSRYLLAIAAEGIKYKLSIVSRGEPEPAVHEYIFRRVLFPAI